MSGDVAVSADEDGRRCASATLLAAALLFRLTQIRPLQRDLIGKAKPDKETL